LHRQARLADATRTGQGEQTNLFLEQTLLDGRYFVIPTGERATGQEQVIA
jgi:hypothetical protein